MKKSFLVLAMSLAVLSGCTDYSSPEGVLGTALHALSKENIKGFRRTLTGDARAKYGNLVGMADLVKEIDGKALIVLGKTCTQPEGSYTHKAFTCDVQVVEKESGRAFKTVGVDCSVDLHYSPSHSGYCGPHSYDCYRNPGFDREYTVTSCRISKL